MAFRSRRSVITAATSLALLMTPVAPSAAPVVHGAVQLAGTTAGTATAPVAAYRVLQQYNGAPARWNPCQTVPWAFNPVSAPAGGLQVVRTALGHISQLTGLRFQYVGTTGTTPSSAYLRQTTAGRKPLLIGWSWPSRTDLLAGTAPTHVGETRVAWVGVRTAAGLRPELTGGVVAFNGATRAPLFGARSRYTFALHELGHAVGLGHVASTHELMAAVIPSWMRDYGTGDRAGMARVGTRYGCLPTLG
jgi:hypothetical protein